MEDWMWVVPACVLGGGVAAALVVTFRSGEPKADEFFPALARGLGGTCERRSVTSRRDGRVFTCWLADGRSHERGLWVKVAAVVPDALHIWKDRAPVHPLMARVELGERLATGDRAFDARTLLATDFPDGARALLATEARRAALRALFDLGAAGLVLADNELLVAWPVPFSLVTPAAVVTLVGHLATLAGEPPRASEPPAPATASARRERP